MDKAIEQLSLASAPDLEAPPSYQEDSDNWLEVSPEEVDAMLAARSGTASGGRQDQGEGDAQAGDQRGEALSDLARKVEEFVSGEGDMDGARFAEYVPLAFAFALVTSDRADCAVSCLTTTWTIRTRRTRS